MITIYSILGNDFDVNTLSEKQLIDINRLLDDLKTKKTEITELTFVV